MESITRGSTTCPVCGTEASVGLPRSTTDPIVTPEPSPDLDATYAGDGSGRQKRRRFRCPNGHSLYVYFEF